MVRTLDQQTSAEIGFTPKLFARITRFQVALDTKRGAPRWSLMNIAHQLGYFDQMHMVRDFQSLGGALPGEVLTQIGDYQQWSLGPQDRPYTFPT